MFIKYFGDKKCNEFTGLLRSSAIYAINPKQIILTQIYTWLWLHNFYNILFRILLKVYNLHFLKVITHFLINFTICIHVCACTHLRSGSMDIFVIVFKIKIVWTEMSRRKSGKAFKNILVRKSGCILIMILFWILSTQKFTKYSKTPDNA